MVTDLHLLAVWRADARTVAALPPFTEWLQRRTDSTVVLWLSETVVEPLLRVLALLVVVLVALRVARTIINRAVARASRPMGPHERRLRQTVGILDEEEDLARRGQRARSLGALAWRLTGTTIWVLATFAVLNAFGINLGPLIAGAGIAGLAIGFGAQSLVKDLISGVFMLIEDQYGIGDVIDVGPATGVVEAVTLRTTRLRDAEGTLWHVPNGEIRRIGNMSQPPTDHGGADDAGTPADDGTGGSEH